MLKIEFTTDGAAFTGDEEDELLIANTTQRECARILRRIADGLAYGRTNGSVFDVNGNTIGSWSLD